MKRIAVLAIALNLAGALQAQIVPTFCDNFDTQDIWKETSLSGSPWVSGAPSGGGFPSTPNSAPDVWGIGLTGAYLNSSDSYLISPQFNLSGAYGAKLSCWLNFDTEQNWDGTQLEYSTDSVLWQPLGTVNDVNGINWYNQVIQCSGMPAWSNRSYLIAGNINGWIRAEFNLSAVGLDSVPAAWFRFHFCSDPSVTQIGFAIDDFCIFIPFPVDAGVTDVFSFSNASLLAGQTDSVVVAFKNYGLDTLTSVNFYFRINNGPPVGPYLWNGILPPNGSTIPFILAGLNYTVPAGPYNLYALSSLINDGDHSNDTLYKALHGFTLLQGSYNTPYCDSFDTVPSYWDNVLLATGFPNTNWQQGMPAYGVTYGTHSGAKAWDINLTQPYYENANTALYSPFFEIPVNGDPVLSFYQNRNTLPYWTGTHLEYTINGGITWTTVGILNDPNGTHWYNSTIYCSNTPGWSSSSGGWEYCEYRDLSVLNGQTVQFRFVFCSDNTGTLDGISIDDFCLILPPPLSASANSLTVNNPIPLYFPGQCLPFKASFSNSGNTDITTLTANLFVDGNLIDSDVINFSNALVPGAVSPLHFFSNCYTATPGVLYACVETINPNGSPDLYPSDDSLCITFSVLNSVDLTSGSPYCEDFETQEFFIPVNAINYSNVSSWKCGSPLKTYIWGAYTGTKAWVTELTQSYPPNDQSALISPEIIFNTNTSYNFSFWTKFRTEPVSDGGTVQYSTDYGVSWNTIGSNLDPQWMNTANIIAINPTPPPNISGWSGLNSGWEQKQHLLCFPSSPGTNPVNVIFRFLFMSDLFTQDEGWEIDNLCIEPDATLCTVGVQEIPGINGLMIGNNVPDPFYNSAKIIFGIPSAGLAEIRITNLFGITVAVPLSGNYSAGLHEINIQRNGLASGIYFYSLTFAGNTITKKMMVGGE